LSYPGFRTRILGEARLRQYPRR